ncbi:MAG: cell division protein FtsX [Bacteroidetes bacterium]|nr:cell division protein FtsX [Bacteroidota bacterium]
MMDSTKNIIKKRAISYFSATASITLVLLMLGLIGLILIQATKLKNQIKENMVLSIFLNENTEQTSIDEIMIELKKSNYCKSVNFISKETAAAEFSREVGEDFVGFLGYNPLRPSIEIRLQAEFATNAQIIEIKSKFVNNKAVAEVSYQQNIFEQIDVNSKNIMGILVGLTIFFFLISIALINSTVRLNLYAQRFLIRSMKLVGATHGFITKPYLVKACFNGLYGGITASILLGSLLFWLPNLVIGIDALYDSAQHFVLFVFLVLFGVIISLISTWYSVNKYLKMKLEDLY